ncbi:hypothetical protein TrST_g158 [Triparma strigata]|uniref:Uncharacterized protein n=1 Tax=Triparma strigata TaxID=1606541 RepID=A0A9W7C1X5_9STRA|nr:hypothetical protein TrST_g158 [Triparma strigata]
MNNKANAANRSYTEKLRKFPVTASTASQHQNTHTEPSSGPIRLFRQEGEGEDSQNAKLVFISSNSSSDEDVESNEYDSIRRTDSDGVDKFPVIHSSLSPGKVRMSAPDVKLAGTIVPMRDTVGLTVRILSTLLLGYFDVITDIKVALAYHRHGYETRMGNPAYWIAVFIIFTLVAQALGTSQQYRSKSWKECYGRSLIALLGGAPLMEGISLWRGREDPDLLFPPSAMYAGIKGIEVAFESVPESIVQALFLLSLKKDEIQAQPIYIIGLCSSILCGAFVMTDGNFGFTRGKHRQNPRVPNYQWLPDRNGSPASSRLYCKIGMFLFFASYFSQFVATSSIFMDILGWCHLGQAMGIEFGLLLSYMWYKGELFGSAVLAHPTIFSNYIAPFITYLGYYLLVCACPMLIAAAPCELGSEVFAAIVVWRLTTNGIVSYAVVDHSDRHCDHLHNLSRTSVVAFHAITLLGAVLFITNNTSDPEQGLAGANGEGAAKFRYFEKVTPGKRWFWKRRRGKVLPTVWDNFMT